MTNTANEQIAIIRQRKLQKVLVLKREMPADQTGWPDGFFDLTVGSIVASGSSPNEYCFRSPKEMKIYEAELRAALKDFKDFLVDNAELPEDKRVEI